MANRSEKHPEIITRSGVPLNAEPPLELLRQSFVGVIKLFYVRNHSSETVPAGQVSLRGYAITGGDRSVQRVDVSTDGGESWVTAELQEGNEPWAWRFWETSVDLEPGQYEIVARAWDAAANTQPESAQQIWNFKGYMNNSWHGIKVIAE